MIELLVRADPAQGVEPDALRLRAKVDERIGLYPWAVLAGPRREGPPLAHRPGLVGSGGRDPLPILLRQESPSVSPPLQWHR